MKKYCLFLLLLSTFLSINIFVGCDNIDTNSINYNNDTQYSVEMALIETEKNDYVDYKISIPKITTNDSDAFDFIDTINSRILNDTKPILDNKIKEAKNIYEAYISTQINSHSEEIENRLNRIKNRYSKNDFDIDELLETAKNRVSSYSDIEKSTNSNTINKNSSTSSNDNTNNEEENLKNLQNELDEVVKLMNMTQSELIGEYTPIGINCNYKLKCLDKNYISIYVEICETRSNDYYTQFYYNVDLTNKKLMNIEDFIGSNYKNIVINSINKSIENMSEEQKIYLKDDLDLNNLINNETHFYITNNHGITVTFEKNIISSGTLGLLEFAIHK